MIARIALALAKNGGHPERALGWAVRQWPFAEDVMTRALGTGEVEAGGALVGGEVDLAFITALRSRSVVRRLGATSMPMPAGLKKTPKVTGGAEVNYIGENQNIIPGVQMKLGALQMEMKKLVALVPISGSLMRHAPDFAERIVRADLLAGAATIEDVKFIRGPGTEYEPRGLRYRAPAANVIGANATVNLTNTVDDLEAAMAAVQDADVPMLRPGWIFAPRTERYLMTLRDGNGWAFKEEMVDGGTVFGKPYASTSSVPTNLGGGGDESEVYFADFAEAMIGDGATRIDVAEGAAYFESGQIRAAYSAGDWAVRLIREHDFSLQHEEAVAVLTGVTWGA